MTKTPVALFVFNRPDLAAGALAAIAKARPEHLVVIADGPRADRPDEAQLCERTRAAALSGVTWDCDVELVAAEQNLGCGDRVSSGIAHALGKHGRAIFVEDDCHPDPSFFRYCDELLERYQDDERVGHVGGTSLNRRSREASYFFSGLPIPWGWATWERAWHGYDRAMQGWKTAGGASFFDGLTDNTRAKQLLAMMFDAAARGALDTWDVQWMYHFMARGYLSAQPSVNLVDNVGFGSAATHTSGQALGIRIPPRTQMTFPLVHPATVSRDRRADQAVVRSYTSRRGSVTRLAHNLAHRLSGGRLRGRRVQQL